VKHSIWTFSNLQKYFELEWICSLIVVHSAVLNDYLSPADQGRDQCRILTGRFFVASLMNN
jgi:hypothetical protein